MILCDIIFTIYSTVWIMQWLLGSKFKEWFVHIKWIKEYIGMFPLHHYKFVLDMVIPLQICVNTDYFIGTAFHLEDLRMPWKLHCHS